MEDLFEHRDEEEEFEFDEIRGSHGKKPKMAILNKKKLSSFEMDELFMMEWYDYLKKKVIKLVYLGLEVELIVL